MLLLLLFLLLLLLLLLVSLAACYRFTASSLHKGHRHRTAEPGTARAPDEPSGAEPLGLLHRERSGAEHVPIGTTDDGALHQVLESLPQEPRPAAARRTTKGHITGRTRRPSRRHSDHTRTLPHASTVRPNSSPRHADPLPRDALGPQGFSAGGQG
ncbi:hypothetical protein GCM10010350_44310 [Streptomyces galilaeus]|nr:hypothetical protein GCM10010350_44310 [Streptomyces galilaeus]